MSRFAAVSLAFVCACGAAVANPPSTSPAITAERARAIALETGAASGYDRAVYTEVGEPTWRDDGTWWVLVEHAPPAPPGGHYAVSVDGATGAATLRPGE